MNQLLHTAGPTCATLCPATHVSRSARIAAAGTLATLLLACSPLVAHADSAPAFTAALQTQSATYDGVVHTPQVVVTGEDGQILDPSCYSVSHDEAINAGTYAVSVTGKGAYAGQTSQLDFTVKPKKLTAANAKLAYTSKTYANYAYTPAVTVKRTVNGTVRTLKKSTDYTVAYEKERANAGTHTVTVTGTGNFSGTVTCSYTIAKRSLSKFSATLSTSTYTANGKAKKPAVTVKGRMGGKNVTLKKDRDFTVSYKNNVKPGTATVTVTGKGNFSGSKKLTFRINSSTEAYLYKKIANKTSSTKYIIAVSCSKHRVGIYQGSKGKWKQIKYWKCTNGAPSTPSKKGTFTVGSRGKAFGSGYTCWYWTQWSGNYLFHSVLYNPGSMKSVQDGRLGIAASHGCIRLALQDAKWIYNNIPRGTKVVVW